ncbi:DNA helicase Pif1-like, partial [Trinorchestia longiramus]
SETILVNNDEDVNILSTKVILTPKNADALKINSDILALIPGGDTVYQSIDSVCTHEDEAAINYTPEFLNSLNLSGMPPHNLNLKRGAIVMLL